MQFRFLIFLVILTVIGALSVGCRSGQPPAGTASATPPPQVHANLQQLMRGVLFPNSNVLFAAQDEKGVMVKQASDPSLATDPLTSAYGQWEAVQNSALALAESASLLTIPGRKCANGRPVPMQNEDWAKYVQVLRDAGMAAYKAAQSKDQDQMLDAAGTVTTACSGCHEKYREKPGGDADRCM